MEFFEVIKKRHCTRSFDPDKEISQDNLDKIIEAGKSAPSAGGIYPTDFAIAKDQKQKESLAQAALGQNFISKAPVVIVIFADLEKTAQKYGEKGRNLYAIQDSAAATENIFLAAIALGLSACWVGAFDEEKVQKILNLSSHHRPLTIMPVGYAK